MHRLKYEAVEIVLLNRLSTRKQLCSRMLQQLKGGFVIKSFVTLIIILFISPSYLHAKDNNGDTFSIEGHAEVLDPLDMFYGVETEHEIVVCPVQNNGENVILVYVDGSFEYHSNERMQQITDSLQKCAVDAGLLGEVVPVWGQGSGYSWRSSESATKMLKTIEIARYLQSDRAKTLICKH